MTEAFNKLFLLMVFVGGHSMGETIQYETVVEGKKNLRGARDLSELHSELILQETVPHFSQPVIGGLMGDRILLTVDGIRFSNAMFRDGPNQYYSWIPQEFVETATLNPQLGGISSGALGGSVDRRLGVQKSQLLMSYDGGDQGLKQVVKYKSSHQSFGLLSEKTGNVETTKGEVEHSSYNQMGLFASQRSERWGKTQLLMSHSGPIDRTDKFAEGKYYVFKKQQLSFISHDYQYPQRPLRIIPSFQQFREVIDQNSPTKNNTDVTNNIFGLQVVGLFDEALPPQSTLRYGLVNQLEALDYLTGTIKTDYHYTTGSAWITYDHVYNQDWALAVRYKYSAMSATGSGLSRQLDNQAIGLDFNYHWEPGKNFFFSLDSGYKFPTITNLAEVRNDALSEIANSELSQEKAISLQMGYDYEERLSLIAFHKKLEDLIVRKQTDIPDGPGRFKWRYSMVDHGFISGLQLKYRHQIRSAGFVAFLEYLNGRNDYDYFAKMTPFHGVLKVTQQFQWLGQDQVQFAWDFAPPVPSEMVSLADSQDIRVKNQNKGYDIVSIGYETLMSRVHQLRFDFQNLFDKEGRVYGSSVDFAGRNLKVTYAYIY